MTYEEIAWIGICALCLFVGWQIGKGELLNFKDIFKYLPHDKK